MTPTDARLAFVVRFTQTDLLTLSWRGWPLLRRDIRNFLSDNNERIVERSRKPWTIAVSYVGFGESLDRLLTQEGIADLQNRTKLLLWSALQDVPSPEYTIPLIMRYPYSTGVTDTSFNLFRARSWFVTVRSEAAEAFLFAVMLLIARGADTQLRQCPACKNIFVRIRRKKYCSPRCKNRTNVHNYRGGPKAA